MDGNAAFTPQDGSQIRKWSVREQSPEAKEATCQQVGVSRIVVKNTISILAYTVQESRKWLNVPEQYFHPFIVG